MADDQPSDGPRLPIHLMVVGSEMVSFTLLGLVLDYFLGTMPGFTVALTLFGVGVAFWHLVQMSKRVAAQATKKKPPAPPAPPARGPG